MLRILFLMIFSGCAGSIERPDAPICVANAPKKYVKCYNLKTDYRDDGKRIAGAKPTYYRLATVEDVNKWTMTTQHGFGEIRKTLGEARRYINQLHKDLERCKR